MTRINRAPRPFMTRLRAALSDRAEGSIAVVIGASVFLITGAAAAVSTVSAASGAATSSLDFQRTQQLRSELSDFGTDDWLTLSSQTVAAATDGTVANPAGTTVTSANDYHPFQYRLIYVGTPDPGTNTGGVPATYSRLTAYATAPRTGFTLADCPSAIGVAASAATSTRCITVTRTRSADLSEHQAPSWAGAKPAAGVVPNADGTAGTLTLAGTTRRTLFTFDSCAMSQSAIQLSFRWDADGNSSTLPTIYHVSGRDGRDLERSTPSVLSTADSGSYWVAAPISKPNASTCSATDRIDVQGTLSAGSGTMAWIYVAPMVSRLSEADVSTLPGRPLNLRVEQDGSGTSLLVWDRPTDRTAIVPAGYTVGGDCIAANTKIPPSTGSAGIAYTGGALQLTFAPGEDLSDYAERCPTTSVAAYNGSGAAGPAALAGTSDIFPESTGITAVATATGFTLSTAKLTADTVARSRAIDILYCAGATTCAGSYPASDAAHATVAGAAAANRSYAVTVPGLKTADPIYVQLRYTANSGDTYWSNAIPLTAP